MPKTISFHNGSSWSRGHNIRDERYTNKQEHIDKTLSEQNITVRDVPVRQAYADIFGQSVEEYNIKQKRSDRHINDYYNKIKQDKRKHPVYECIVQIGDRSDTGNSAIPEKQALKQFAEEWDKRNPNLRLIGAYIHCDEPDGTVHMHLDYIPVAKCTRGMQLQNSLDRALQQQGFHSENIHQTAQIEWQDRERDALCKICKSLGINVQREQGISENREHLSKREYIRAKEKQQVKIEEELKPLREETEKAVKELAHISGIVIPYQDLIVKAEKIETAAKKIPKIMQLATGQKEAQVQISEEDWNKIKEQAISYTMNRDEIAKIRTAKEKIKKEITVIREERKKITAREEKVTQKEYRQENLNELLIKAENKAKMLEQEKITLKADNEKLKITVNELKIDKEEIESLRKQVAAIPEFEETIAENKKNKTKISQLEQENGTLKTSIKNLKDTVKTLQDEKKELLSDKEEGFARLTMVAKAVGMLKYDDGKYKANLTPPQQRLIDGIANYAEKATKNYGYKEFAEEISKKVGISKGIETEIKALQPKERGR
ncbi:MAG: plasmid recombination protein [Firmicutes bacterium]|nr:plasmid recombination protein [Bacillota bacterium]